MKYCFLFLTLIFMMGFTNRIHFESNSYHIDEGEKEKLDQNVSWLEAHSGAVLILEGHCDEWGEDTYNLELGDRRARETKHYMIQKGIDPERIIMVVSFGEAQPLDPRHQKEAWKKNRRVEFVLR